MQGVRGSQIGPGSAPIDNELTTTIQVLSECGKPKEEIAQMLGINAASVDAALQQDRYAVAAKYLAKKKKMPLEAVGQALNMSEARVHGAVQSHGSAGHAPALAGRLLGNVLQAKMDKLCDEDSEMCCPVTLMLFREPVIASDGFMYEEESVKQLIRNNQKSPITREPLKKEYFRANQKKSEVTTFRETRSKELLQFAEEALDSQPRMAHMALDRVLEYLEVLKPSQCPAISRPAAALWEKSGRALPPELRPFVGLS